MCDFLRRLRAELDRVGRQRGRRLELSLWLPTPEHMRILRPMWPDRFIGMDAWGLDVDTWIEEGLVDVLMPSLYSPDLGMDEPVAMPDWVDRAQSRGIEVRGCLMNLRPDSREPGATPDRVLDVIRGTGAACDGVFLFNTQPIHLASILAARD
jgi:hypothetical protein